MFKLESKIRFFVLLGLLLFLWFSGQRTSSGPLKDNSYETTKTILIDSLVQSTFIGGDNWESGYAVAVNPTNGDVYIAGYTSSTDLPGLTGGADVTFGGFQEAYIARFSSDLKTLYQSTYLGGSGEEVCNGIAIDSTTGDVYVTGYTTSDDFPGIAGGADITFAGYNEAFVARFSGDLKTLYQSTYLGGESYDAGFGIAVDTSGDVYVTGVTNSTDFPNIAGGADETITGDEAFVSRLSGDLKTLHQSTYLGGGSYDAGTGIAINSTTGDVYITGTTGSNDFPNTSGGADPVFLLDEAFVSRLSSDLKTLYQSTYLGGSEDDAGNGIAIHPASGDVYVTGGTISSDFPNISGGMYHMVHNGGADETFEEGEAFVSRLSSDLTILRQSTYLGGEADETGHSIAVHPTTGEIFVTGYTASEDFPGIGGGADITMAGNEGFVSRLSDDLDTLYQSSYIGGRGPDAGNGIVINPNTGKIYVAGSTGSADFPKITGGGDETFSNWTFAYEMIYEGTDGEDTLIDLGTEDNDLILQNGMKGNDVLYLTGDYGNDWLGQDGGKGNDTQTIRSGTGNDLLCQTGGAGDDRLNADGATGDDQVFQCGGIGKDYLDANTGSDNDFVYQAGGYDDDSLVVNSGVVLNDIDKITVDGGSGNDEILYEVGDGPDNVFIDGGTGYDTLTIHLLEYSSARNFTLRNEKGVTLISQGTGGSDIWLRSVENVIVVDTGGNTVFQLSVPNNHTGGPDLSTREAGLGEAFITLFEITGSNAIDVDEDTKVPNVFSLEQNYPNPFNPYTTIKFKVQGSKFKVPVYAT